MKKICLFFSVLFVVISAFGCDLKIERDVFYLPQDEIESIEIQREYFHEEDGTSYFQSKKITEKSDLKEIGEKIRKLPVKRASSGEPHPITDFSLIILIKGKREHHLILTEKMAFYDQIAYEYNDSDTYNDFIKLYNDLEYSEEKTEPDRF